jgi:hypothetical protein
MSHESGMVYKGLLMLFLAIFTLLCWVEDWNEARQRTIASIKKNNVYRNIIQERFQVPKMPKYS